MKHYLHFRDILLCGALLLPLTWAPAQQIPSRHDLNGDGLLNDEEMALQVIYFNDKDLAAADTIEKDGLLSEAEINNAVKAFERGLRAKLATQAKVKQDTLDRVHAGTRGVPVPVERGPEFTGLPRDGGPVFQPPLFGLQIRRKPSDIDMKYPPSQILPEEAAIAYLSKISPAEFSFAYNGLNGEETWIARGVVARPWLLTEPGQGEWAWALNPYVNFERVSKSINRSSEIDRLTFTTALTGITPGLGPIGSSYLDAGFDYTTNFDFDGQIYSGHLTWTPVLVKPVWWANEKVMPVPIPGLKSLGYSIRQYLHLEGGSAQRLKIPAGPQEFLRAGPAIGMDLLVPVGERRLTLSADYRFFADLLSHDDDHYNLRLAANMTLDTLGHLTLQAAYERGLVAISQQSVDLVTVGFGLRF